MENTLTIPVIEKEEIVNLKFPSTEVLNDPEQIKKRLNDLERATRLGNAEHGKIKITFEDSVGIKKVNTTVWATTDKRIILKKGVVIPIHRIHEVDI
jgi:hypothetical protein